jgi:zinc transporter
VTSPFGSAIVLDGGGGIRATSMIDGQPWADTDGPAVILLGAGDPRAVRWLAENTGLSDADCGAFLSPIQRTWAAIFESRGEPVLALLLEPSAHRDPYAADAPAAARLLVSARRLVAVLNPGEPTPMFDRARQALQEHHGARSPLLLFIDLARAWTSRYLSDVLSLERAVAALEDGRPDPQRREAIESLHVLRRDATSLGRRVSSLRLAIHSVNNVASFPPLLDVRDAWAGVVREADELVHLTEAVIVRVEITDDYFQRQLSAALSDRLYVLTLISAVLLPLSFVTGLLGVNVAGIPLRDSPWAFWLLCAVLVVIAGGQYFLARRLRWLPGRSSRLVRRSPRG